MNSEMPARTLYEIIEDAQDGKMPSHEECYYALLAYQAMFTLDHHKLIDELMEEKRPAEFIRKIRAENSFNMVKKALSKLPKEWLVWNNDPMNSEYQKFRKMGKMIFEKVIAKDEQEENK